MCECSGLKAMKGVASGSMMLAVPGLMSEAVKVFTTSSQRSLESWMLVLAFTATTVTTSSSALKPRLTW